MNRITARCRSDRLRSIPVRANGVRVVSLIELVMSFGSTPYEGLLAMLRNATLSVEQRERVLGELHSRDRAMHNQWVQVCGGEFQ